MKVSDYLLNPTIDSMANILNIWNSRKVHNNFAYDLDSYREFYIFANVYGLDKALSCQDTNYKYWIGGNDVAEPIPFPNDIEKAKNFLDYNIDVEEILEYEWEYKGYFDIDLMREDKDKFDNDELPANNKSKNRLHYHVVCQHFTLALVKFLYTKATTNKVEAEEKGLIKILTNPCFEFDKYLEWIYNISNSFTNKYKYTEWETSFEDYAERFIRKEICKYRFFDEDSSKIKKVFDEFLEEDDLW